MSTKLISEFITTNGDMRHVVAPKPPPELQAVYDDARSNNGKRVLRRTPTRLNYVPEDTVTAKLKRDPNGDDSAFHGVSVWNECTTWIENGRELVRRSQQEEDRATTKGCSPLTLEANGFELISKEPVLQEALDFCNKDEVMDHYYPQCEKLLAECLSRKENGRPDGPGVAVVRAFDHNIRKQATKEGGDPIGIVHGDYTSTSGPRRVEQLGQPPKINDVWHARLGADKALLDPDMVQDCVQGKRRFALVNVWRSTDIQNAVRSFPLACMDAKSYSRECLRILELHYSDRIGENFLLCAPPPPPHSLEEESKNKNDTSSSQRNRYRWYFFPEMTFDEALLIKQWDSQGDFAQGRAKDESLSTMAIHSAFMDPQTNKDDPPRQSIEVRCVIIWDKEPSEEKDNR